MIDHVSIQCNDLAASAAFYDAVLAPLGGKQCLNVGNAIGYGVTYPDFWIGMATTEGQVKEAHVAFSAAERSAVLAFFETAVALGAEVLHEPRLWPEYDDNYFAAFVRDPDGNNVEAVCHAPS